MLIRSPILLLLTTSMSCWAAELSYNRDIRPILSENCFYCHGQDANQRKKDLRLDDRVMALARKAFVPGDAAGSELVKRIFTNDPDDQMPPPNSHRHLTETQRELLKRWVAEGAKYETHWAFRAPVKPPVPAVKREGWARNEVDRFIQAGVESAGLEFSPEADRATLLRRLSLDLTGLPPTPGDVDAFVADHRPDAYEAWVDRIMSSPHYGERMALPWLDAARYADSNGFQQDGDTHQYVWRDWVVRALNADMPFDQFSIEQLAGDLLPEPTEDQLVATAFNRNHLLNGEGGAIPEEQRNVVLFDRVDTTSTTWMGLTVACAQCHDHKYDPITQRDYYSLMAYFNQVPETGVPSGDGQYRIADPWIAVGTDAERALLKERETAVAKAKEEEKKIVESGETRAAYEVTEKLLGGDAPLTWQVIRPENLTATDGVELSVLDDASVVSGGARPDKANYVLRVSSVGLAAMGGLRIETLPDDRFPSKGAGRSDSGNAVLSKIRVKVGGKDVVLTAASATYAQGGFPPEGVLDENPDTGWAFYPETSKPYSLFLQLAEPVLVPAGAGLEVILEFQSPNKQHLLGRFRLSVTSAAHPAKRALLPKDIAAIAEKKERTQTESAVLREYVVKNFVPPPVAAARRATQAAEKAVNDQRRGMVRVMVMSDKKPRQTKILDRGNYLTPREDVTAEVPAFLPSMPKGAPKNRLGFAQWLFLPEHPLTARVQVNRMWQYFFGTGLVKTSEDLGVQSEVPVHGALLDWLAVEFREKGWSQKHLVRMIVTSSTYRQSSRVSREHQQRDPENRWAARASRFRMPSLVLRDIALSASGLLQPRMGGKPVYPYQPGDVWETLAITKERDFTYPASSGADLYRRSLYTFWRRTVGPVNMFDASPRQACKVRSSVTSTPLHALTTLNDVTWTEAARVLAERSMKAVPAKAERIEWAFRRVLTRRPTSADLDRLGAAYERQLAYYRTNEAAASDFLSTGSSPRDASLPLAEHAALSAVCVALFNLDESLTRQ